MYNKALHFFKNLQINVGPLRPQYLKFMFCFYFTHISHVSYTDILGDPKSETTSNVIYIYITSIYIYISIQIIIGNNLAVKNFSYEI